MNSKFHLDCLGEICPVPLLKVQEQVSQMTAGDTLTVSVDYSCAMKNIPDWAESEGHKVEVETAGNGEWKITIIKTE